MGKSEEYLLSLPKSVHENNANNFQSTSIRVFSDHITNRSEKKEKKVHGANSEKNFLIPTVTDGVTK